MGSSLSFHLVLQANDKESLCISYRLVLLGHAALRISQNSAQCEELRHPNNCPSWNPHPESRRRRSMLGMDLVEVSEIYATRTHLRFF